MFFIFDGTNAFTVGLTPDKRLSARAIMQSPEYWGSEMAGQRDSSGKGKAAEDEAPQTVRPALDQKVQDAIGRSLKAHYDDLVNAPIPDKFLALLAELEAKEVKSRD